MSGPKSTFEKSGWYMVEWLRYLKKSQADLVRATNYPKSRVSDWINGERPWDVIVLGAFSRATGIDRTYLISVDPSSPEGAKIAEQGRLPTPPALPVQSKPKPR